MSSQNVRVFARFRPLNSRERKLRDEGKDPRYFKLTFTNKKSVAIIGERQAKSGNPLRMTFDGIYDHHFSQAAFFAAVAQTTVDDVLQGYNGTIFAYGQTGSGKTYCMFGPSYQELEKSAASKKEAVCQDSEGSKIRDKSVEEQFNVLKGIAPRCSEYLFHLIAEGQDIEEATIKVSALEIYMEIIRDLLNPDNNSLKIREEADGTYGVRGLSGEYASSPNDILDMCEDAMRNRTVASTGMNKQSSRSHCVLVITVNMKLTDGTIKIGKLNLADLAGSEKVKNTRATGSLLKEATKINQSLSALGNCINALTDKKRHHIPYRDSKLTFLLKDSLGGNCKTTLIVACSPSATNAEETISTLHFAARAKSITNKATVNKQHSVEELVKIVASLKKQIAKYKRHGPSERQPPSNSGDKSDLWILRSQHEEQVNQLKEDLSEQVDKNIYLDNNLKTVRNEKDALESKAHDLELIKTELTQENKLQQETIADQTRQMQEYEDSLAEKDAIIKQLRDQLEEEDAMPKDEKKDQGIIHDLLGEISVRSSLSGPSGQNTTTTTTSTATLSANHPFNGWGSEDTQNTPPPPYREKTDFDEEGEASDLVAERKQARSAQKEGERQSVDSDSSDNGEPLALEEGGNTTGGTLETNSNTTLEGMDLKGGDEQLRKMMRLLLQKQDESRESQEKLAKAKTEKETLMKLLLQQQSRADTLKKKRQEKIETIRRLKERIVALEKERDQRNNRMYRKEERKARRHEKRGSRSKIVTPVKRNSLIRMNSKSRNWTLLKGNTGKKNISPEVHLHKDDIIFSIEKRQVVNRNPNAILMSILKTSVPVGSPQKKQMHTWVELYARKRFYIVQKITTGDIHFLCANKIDLVRQEAFGKANIVSDQKMSTVRQKFEAPDMDTLRKRQFDKDFNDPRVFRIGDMIELVEKEAPIFQSVRGNSRHLADDLMNAYSEHCQIDSYK